MSKILAGYVLAVAATYEKAYDKVASDAAVAEAEKRIPEDVRTAPTIAPVTSRELMGRKILIEGVSHEVVKCLTSGIFRTHHGHEGNLKNVRRRGRGFVYLTDAEIAESQRDAQKEFAVSYIDFNRFQTKTIYQCAEEVVPYLYRQPVYLLLQTAWNDAIAWANETMALRDADGDDTHNFRLGVETSNGMVDYQLSAQNELCAAFKLGQIFHQDLSIETVKLL